MIAHCSTAWRVGHLDAVEAEQVGRLLEVVDDVVDLGRELVDVLAVERRQVLRVE